MLIAIFKAEAIRITRENSTELFRPYRYVDISCRQAVPYIQWQRIAYRSLKTRYEINMKSKKGLLTRYILTF